MITAVPMHLAPKPHLRGWSHAVAAVAAIALCPLVIVFSPGARAAAAIFSGGIIGLFAVSATYHRFQWNERMHGFWRRLDHSMIFIAIASIYTPIAAVALPPTTGKVILAVVWTGAGLGVLTQLFWLTAPRWILVSLYLAVGWVAIVVVDDVWRTLGVAGFVLLAVGGLLHTVGATVYASKRPDPWPTWFGFHEIFHLFVVAAIAAHYVLVVFFALPQATV